MEEFGQQIKKMDRSILEMLATDIRPFAFVNDVGFKRLFELAEPRYEIKSEKYYREMLPKIYDEVAKKIKTLVTKENAGDWLSFTTDCWSGQTESLMSLTAHFIDENWKPCQVILNVKALTGSHTGEYISQEFLGMLQQWGIEKERVLLVLRDAGSNMIKGMRIIDIENLSCLAHTLQRVIEEGLAAQRSVINLLAKLRRMATHFNHSVLAKQRICTIQGQLCVPEHAIVQAIPTRWNSSLIMLERMLEQKRALTVYQSEYGQISCPTQAEWNMVPNVIATLKPFHQITLDISKKNATLSEIIPSIRALQKLLETNDEVSHGIQTMRGVMLASINRRFSDIEDVRPVVMSCLLDPRYKDRVLSPDASNQANAWLAEEIASLAEGQEPSPTEKRRRVDSASFGSLDSAFESLLEKDYAPCQGSDAEIMQYLGEPVANRKSTNIHQWWKMNSSRLGILANIARKYLATPPTSVPSERLFSTIGNIYQDNRASLLGENAEKLDFLHDNLRFLEWNYQ